MRAYELFEPLTEYAIADFTFPRTGDVVPVYVNPTKSEFFKILTSSGRRGVRMFILLETNDVLAWDGEVLHVDMLKFLLKIKAYSGNDLKRFSIIGLLIIRDGNDYFVQVLDWGMRTTDETEYYVRDNEFLKKLIGDFKLEIDPSSSERKY